MRSYLERIPKTLVIRNRHTMEPGVSKAKRICGGKRMYSREFKLSIVRQILTGDIQPDQACREYGLTKSILSSWRKEYEERGDKAFLPRRSSLHKRRIAELEQFCGQLAFENQKLKEVLQLIDCDDCL